MGCVCPAATAGAGEKQGDGWMLSCQLGSIAISSSTNWSNVVAVPYGSTNIPGG